MSKARLRIAFVGGKDFEADPLDRFFLNLKEKHPDAIIVVGEGQGSERAVRVAAELLRFEVVVPKQRPEWYGKDALMCQINDVLIDADQTIIVGEPTSTRPKRALEILKRIYRDSHRLAAPPAKKKAPVKHRPKTKKNAQLFA